MTYVKPGLAAVLCAACRHPARRHTNLDGCLVPDCWCDGEDALTAVVETAVVSPPSAAELALLDARCLCGHVRTEHRVAGSSVICRATPCLCHRFAVPGDALPWNAVELEATDAPVAPQAEPTPPVLAAPVPARPPARKAQPRRGPAEPRLATAGLSHERPRPTPARPAAPSALGSAAVFGEPDAVEEVAAAAVDEPVAVTVEPLPEKWSQPAATHPIREAWVAGRPAASTVHWDPPPAYVRLSPSPFDFEPFLARALYVSARWYCPKCHQWPLDPGACPACRKPLQAVYHVTIPRSLV